MFLTLIGPHVLKCHITTYIVFIVLMVQGHTYCWIFVICNNFYMLLHISFEKYLPISSIHTVKGGVLFIHIRGVVDGIKFLSYLTYDYYQVTTSNPITMKQELSLCHSKHPFIMNRLSYYIISLILCFQVKLKSCICTQPKSNFSKYIPSQLLAL